MSMDCMEQHRFLGIINGLKQTFMRPKNLFIPFPPHLLLHRLMILVLLLSLNPLLDREVGGLCWTRVAGDAGSFLSFCAVHRYTELFREDLGVDVRTTAVEVAATAFQR